MTRTLSQVFLFMVLVLGTFIWIGSAITAMTGGGGRTSGGVVEITPEGGEEIFWGRGRCFTCHSIGDRGSAVRGPNQGVFGEKFTESLGIRAIARAAERSEKTGRTYTRTDYLVESLATPGAYVVEGYKNEMAITYAPPISLGLLEIKAVLSYLQSLGGDFDLEAIETPSEITEEFFAKIAAASAAGGGDPDNGEFLYEDLCLECHTLGGGEELLGPDLAHIGDKGLNFISESILNPAKKITEGFVTTVVEDLEGRRTVGLKISETADEVVLIQANGREAVIAKADIKEMTDDPGVSLMPDDMAEIMTVKDYQDLRAYLIMQKAPK